MNRQIIFVGDVHAKVEKFSKIVSDEAVVGFPRDIVQVGDIGFGFSHTPIHNTEHVHVLRGNHDNPALARQHPNYVGDYGVKNIGGHEIFYVSGAWSIDHQQRIPGRDWWSEEELSYSELNDAADLYLRTRPEIVVTHDCPSTVSREILRSFGPGYEPIKTRTGTALQTMFEYHQPKVWVFGHYHVARQIQIGRALFCCLPELGTITLENLMSARSTID